MVGRARGAILFPEDIFVSPHHATLILREGRLFVRDEGSLSGVFVTLSSGDEPLASGQSFSAGERLFRFIGPLPRRGPSAGSPIPYGAPVTPGQPLYALEEVLVGGRPGRTAVSAGPLMTVGQQHCDLSFASDEGLAPRHCEVSPTTEGATLRDVSGGRRTFIRLPSGSERLVAPGDRIRIGLHVLQVDQLA